MASKNIQELAELFERIAEAIRRSEQVLDGASNDVARGLEEIAERLRECDDNGR